MTNPFAGNPFDDLTSDLDDPFADLTADLPPAPKPVAAPRLPFNQANPMATPSSPSWLPTNTSPFFPSTQKLRQRPPAPATPAAPLAPVASANPFAPQQTPTPFPTTQGSPFRPATQQLPEAQPIPTGVNNPFVIKADAATNPVERAMARLVLQGTKKTDPFGANEMTDAQRRQADIARRAGAMANAMGEFGVQTVGGVADAGMNTVQGLAELGDMILPGDPGMGEAVGRARDYVSNDLVGQPETVAGMAGRGIGYLGGTVASYLIPSTLAAKGAATLGTASRAGRALNFLANPLGKAGLTPGGNLSVAGKLASGTMLNVPTNVAMGLSPDNSAQGFVALQQEFGGGDSAVSKVVDFLGTQADKFDDSAAGRVLFENAIDFLPNAGIAGGQVARDAGTYMRAARAARQGNVPRTVELTRELMTRQEARSPFPGGQPTPEMPSIPKKITGEQMDRAAFNAEVDRLKAIIETGPKREARQAEQQLQQLIESRLPEEPTGAGQVQGPLQWRGPQRFGGDLEKPSNEPLLTRLNNAALDKTKQSIDFLDAATAPTAKASFLRGVGGAVGGYLTGDTPEERTRRAALFGGAGTLLGTAKAFTPGLTTKVVGGGTDFASRLYSRLENQIASAPFERGMAEQWAAHVAKNTAKGEREFTGVDAFLKENAGKVLTRQQVQEVFDRGRVRLAETQYGKGLGRMKEADEAKVMTNLDAFIAANPTASEETLLDRARMLIGTMPSVNRWHPDYYEMEEAAAWHFLNGQPEKALLPVGTPAKFNTYTVPGERTNYREVMIQQPGPEQFRYAYHWDEPNVMTHVRFSDRIINGLKTLFVEETQDDWAQATRKATGPKDPVTGKKPMRGWQTPEQQQEFMALQADLEVKQQTVNALREQRNAVRDQWDQAAKRLYAMRPTTPEEVFQQVGDEVQRLNKERDLLTEQLRQANNDYAVAVGRMEMQFKGENAPLPSGRPFRQTAEWAELALKRALDEAVQGGYDQVAFTTGRQSADMFSLRYQADKLEWDTTNAKPGTGSLYISKNGEGIKDYHNVPEWKLSEYVGEELAESLLQKGTLKGKELEVGGKGMIAFYDTMLPNIIKDYSKKLGVPLQVRRVGGDTDAMRQELQLLKAQHEEAKIEKLAAGSEFDRASRDFDRDLISDIEVDQARDAYRSARQQVSQLATRIEELQKAVDAPLSSNLVIDIGPQVREKILTEGQPLWAQMDGSLVAPALGGAAGASEGDDPSERFANAILMAGAVSTGKQVMQGGGVRNILRGLAEKDVRKMIPEVAERVMKMDPETGYAPAMYAALRGVREQVRQIGRNPEALLAKAADYERIGQTIREGIASGQLTAESQRAMLDFTDRLSRGMRLLAKRATDKPSAGVSGDKTVLQAMRDEADLRVQMNPDLQRIAVSGTDEEKAQAVIDFAKPILRESLQKAMAEYGTEAKWYDEAVRDMQALATLAMPELAEPKTFMLFNYMGSILSNGNPVTPELNAALVVMQQYLRTGKFSIFAVDPKTKGSAPMMQVLSEIKNGVAKYTERPMFGVGDDGDVLKGNSKFRTWETALGTLQEVVDRHKGNIDSVLQELTGRGFTDTAEARIKRYMNVDGLSFSEAVAKASVNGKGKPVNVYTGGGTENRLRSTQLFGPKIGQYGTDKTMWMRDDLGLPFPKGVDENATNDLWMARLYNLALGRSPEELAKKTKLPTGKPDDSVTGPMHSVLNEVQRRLADEVGREVLGRPMQARNVQALLWEAMKSKLGELGAGLEVGAFDTLETAAAKYLFGSPGARGPAEVEAIARSGLSGYRPGFVDRQVMNEIARTGGLTAGGLALQGSEDERLKATGRGLVGLAFGRLAYKGAKAGLPKTGAAKALVENLRQSEQGRLVLNALSRDILTDPRVKEVVESATQEMAKNRAIGQELAAASRKFGPEGDRMISDLIEGESIEDATQFTPEQMAEMVALANRIADQVQDLGKQKVEQGLMSEATRAKRDRTYLRRMYANFDAEDAMQDATVNSRGKTFRIKGENVRNDALTLEERDALGEIREASYRLAETFGRGGRDVATARLFNTLAEMPGVIHPEYKAAIEQMLTAKAFAQAARAKPKGSPTAAKDAMRSYHEARATVQDISRRFTQPERQRNWLAAAAKNDEYVRLPDTPQMGVLRGAVVRADVADYLQDLPDMQNTASTFAKLLSKWKAVHTVYNLGTHVGNALSNAVMVHMAGISLPEQTVRLPKALKDLREYGPATRALAEAGVLERGIPMYGDVPVKGLYQDKKVMRQLAGTTRIETLDVLQQKGVTPFGRGERLANAVLDKSQKVYALGDGLYRVMVAQKALDQGKSAQAAVQAALKALPTYETRSPALKALKNTASPFILYPAKYIPALLDNIAEYPERWAVLAGLWGGLDQYSRRKYGAMDEKDLPPNQRVGKNSGYLLPPRVQVDALVRPAMERLGANLDPSTKYTIDMGRWTPLTALTGSPNPGGLATQLGDNVPGILQPGGPVIDLAARALNRDPFTGEPWMKPSDLPSDKAKKVMEAAAGLTLPSMLSFHAPRVAQDIKNDDMPAAAVDALGFLGMRPTAVTQGMQTARERRLLQDALASARSELNREIRKAKSVEREEELIRRYEQKVNRLVQSYQPQ